VAYKDADGPSIGVLWSSHTSSGADSYMYFAHHLDSDASPPNTANWSVEQIYGGKGGTCLADDHINLKSLQADPSSGALFAAVKTSIGDSGCPSTGDGLRLLVRKPDKSWKVTAFSANTENYTRPIVVLDSENKDVYMFATAPTSCGAIYYKKTTMANPSFPAKADPFIINSTYSCLNNATSTKQPVNNSTGLVVMASNETSGKRYYLHNLLPLGGQTTTATPTATSTPAATPIPGTATPTATSVPPSGDASIKTITFEGGSLVNTTSGVDAVVQPVALETAAPLKGAYSARIADTSTNPPAATSTGYLREDFSGVDELYASFYIKLSANPGSAARLALVTNGSTSVGALNLNTNGTLQLRNGSTNIGTASPALALGTIYRVGLHQKKGSGNGALEAYLAQGDAAFGTPFATSAAQNFATQATRFSLGATNSNAVNVTVDDIRLDTAGFASVSTPADTTPPSVVARTPGANATDVSLSTAVKATFSEAVTGVSGSSFYMTGPNGTVAASVSYDSANKIATLQPNALLTPGAHYSVFLTSGIKDAANNVLAPMNWQFVTTAPAADTTPPTIVSVSPAANATGVSVGASVTATFSEPVVNLSATTFVLSPGGQPIAAAVTYNSASNTATLLPSAQLLPGTLYTATLWSDITDTAGNPLESFSWAFTTTNSTPTSTPTATSTPPSSGSRIKDMTFEGGLTGADGADSASGTTITRITTGALKGSASAQVANTTSTSAYLQEDFTAVDNLFVSFYLKVNTLPTSDLRIALISNSGTTVGELLLRSTGALRLRNAGTTVGADSAALTAGTTYWIGLVQKKGTSGNAVLQAFLATGDSAFSTPFVQTTTGGWTSQANRLRLGATVSGVVNLIVDDVRLDSGAMP
jgi:hypothetical protein